MTAVLLLAGAQYSVAAAASLRQAGYAVSEAYDAGDALSVAFRLRFDAVVAEAAMPLREFRARLEEFAGRLPFVFIAPASARWAPSGVPFVEGLDVLLASPPAPAEIARAVALVLGPAGVGDQAARRLSGLQIDASSQRVREDRRSVRLTPVEFRLLDYLWRHPRIVPVGELLENVWAGPAAASSAAMVRSHVRNLRAKLRTVAPGREVLETVPRRGYRLVSGDSPG
jgi:DNA-binding response OmpR family regulator